MATSAEIKSNNNTKIRVKTTAKSITKVSVADQLDAGIDYTVQEISTVNAAISGLLIGTDKTYKAKLSQSGTDNITATILKNDTGKTFTFTRSSIGSYSVNFSSMYTDLNKIDIRVNLQTSSYVAPQVLVDNLNVLATIETKYWNGSNFVLSDGILQNSTIYLTVNE